MPSKTSNWMMIVGAFIVLLGICIMPAGLGENGDKNLLGGGAGIFSLGILALASGVYLKAIALRPNGKSADENASSKRTLRGGCDRCQSEVPVIHCKVHQQHLCGSCLAEHYDFRSCVYAPSTRRVHAAQPLAARAGR
jgi:hypothetical protein